MTVSLILLLMPISLNPPIILILKNFYISVLSVATISYNFLRLIKFRPYLFNMRSKMRADVANTPHKWPVVSLLVIYLYHKNQLLKMFSAKNKNKQMKPLLRASQWEPCHCLSGSQVTMVNNTDSENTCQRFRRKNNSLCVMQYDAYAILPVTFIF